MADAATPVGFHHYILLVRAFLYWRFSWAAALWVCVFVPRAAVSSALGWLSAAVYADFVCWPLFYPGAALFSLACIPVGVCLAQPVFGGWRLFSALCGLLIRGGIFCSYNPVDALFSAGLGCRRHLARRVFIISCQNG